MMSITKNTVVGLTSEGLSIECATTRKRARHASLAMTNQDQLGLEIGGNPEEIGATENHYYLCTVGRCQRKWGPNSPPEQEK